MGTEAPPESRPATTSDSVAEAVRNYTQTMPTEIAESRKLAEPQPTMQDRLLDVPPRDAAAAPTSTPPETSTVTIIDHRDTTVAGDALSGELPELPTPAPTRLAERRDSNLDAWDTPVSEPASQGVEDAVMARLRVDPKSPAAVFDYGLIRLLNAKADAGVEDARLAGSGFDERTFGTSVTNAGVLRSSDRKILATVAEGLVAFRDHLEDEPAASAQARIEPIVSVARQLQLQNGLVLPTAQLCETVRGFADYDALAPTFTAGTPRNVVLYVEVDNFQSKRGSDGQFETKISLAATLYDPDGRPVMAVPEKQAVDRVRRARRDFFIADILQLPAETRPGEHVLKVTVKDEHGGRVAQQSVRVEFTER
ncbi:MAG: hypothetical protein AAGK78_02550 [Planctomycetota bacterium]